MAQKRNNESKTIHQEGELFYFGGSHYRLESLEEGGKTARLRDAEFPGTFIHVPVDSLRTIAAIDSDRIEEINKPTELKAFSKQGETFEEANAELKILAKIAEIENLILERQNKVLFEDPESRN